MVSRVGRVGAVGIVRSRSLLLAFSLTYLYRVLPLPYPYYQSDSISFYACPIGYIGVTFLYDLAMFFVLDFVKVR